MATDNTHNQKILVVDDDPIFLRFLTHFFSRREYEVVGASNGREALEHARRFQPDVMVLDLDMPDMNGFETCKVLKADEATRQIPVIILTAMESLELNQKAFDAGAQATVLKSMNRSRLMNIVEVALHAKKGSESSCNG